MATRLHAQHNGVFSLACPIGGERIPLEAYRIQACCSCGATVVPVCRIHGSPMHISSQPPTSSDVAPAVCAALMLLLALGTAAGVALVLYVMVAAPRLAPLSGQW